MFFHPWPPGLSWQELNHELCPVWVQIHGLLLDRLNGITVKNIRDAIGNVLEIKGNLTKQI